MKRTLAATAGWMALTAISEPAAARRATFSPARRSASSSGSMRAARSIRLRAPWRHLRKHIPGNPTIIVQNMPGAGGKTATNHVFERAAPDGLTILYGPWDPLAQALAIRGCARATRSSSSSAAPATSACIYARTRRRAGRHQSAGRHCQGRELALGALNSTDISGLLPHLALQVLGIKHQLIVGYRGGNDVFLAMQRGEVQVHSTSITTFRGRNAALREIGEGIGIAYLVPVDRNGRFERASSSPRCRRSPTCTSRCTVRCRPAHVGCAQLAHQPDRRTDLCGLGAAGDAAEPLAILRKAYEAASNDPEFIADPPSATACRTPISVWSAAAACSARSPTCSRRAGDAARGDRRVRNRMRRHIFFRFFLRQRG